MSWISSFTTKRRSSTFDTFLCGKHRTDVERLQYGKSTCGVRERSLTWHGNGLNVENTQHAYGEVNVKHSDEKALKEQLGKMIANELRNHLENGVDPKIENDFNEKSATIAKVISRRARKMSMGLNKKIVSSVFIGELNGEDVNLSSQCLYDPIQDTFSSGYFRSASIFAVGTLFITNLIQNQ